jgi:CheY-like chemotaxis protein
LKFSVKDTGIGISQEKLSSIFENFVQADSSVSFNYGGTGLGLAISKKLVELMGGKIGVTSTLNQGSNFYFTIRVNSTVTAIENELPKDYSLLLVGRRILVVDDNDTNRFIIRKYLENSSCHLDEACSGDGALDLLRRAKLENFSYDLILLDYRMPNMNGYEVAQAIKNEHLGNSTIVSLLTSDGNQDDLIKLPSVGIMDYLIKPIRRNDFLNLVSKSLSRIPFKTESVNSTPSTAQRTTVRKFKILVVDDIIDNRFVVTSYLDSLHFEFDEASDGRQALDFVYANNYDLILMDMRMAPMDGYKATREIRSWEKENNRQKRIPIVALTAHAMKEEVEKAKLAGCDYHLTKPVTKARLFELIETILKIKLASPALVGQASAPTIEESIKPPRSVTFNDDQPKTEEYILIETESFLRPRLAQYIENRKNELGNIQEAIAKNDYESIITIGHNVAGTSGIYGMMGLSELARKVEQAAIANNTVEILVLIKEMDYYLKRVRF